MLPQEWYDIVAVLSRDEAELVLRYLRKLLEQQEKQKK